MININNKQNKTYSIIVIILHFYFWLNIINLINSTMHDYIKCAIILVLILLIIYVYTRGESFYGGGDGRRGYAVGANSLAGGGYLDNMLKRSGGYIGHPLINSVYDSGADLRDLGTQFSSTDQGSERFKSVPLAKKYK